MQQISLSEAALNLATLVQAVQNGEEVILMQDSLPMAKLVALTPTKTALDLKRQKRQQMFGSEKGSIKMTEDFDEPLPEFQKYMQ